MSLSAVRRRSNIIVLFLTVLSVISCTRKQEETSQISLSLPGKMMSSKVSSQTAATAILGHVVINVTGPGLVNPIVFNWDRHDMGPAGSSAAAPSAFTLNIPQGDSRLFQVLAVYEDPDTKTMFMYYGDTTKSLAASAEIVNIVVSAVGGGSQLISGRVWGRYFDSATSGPTDKIYIKYNPGGGKTSLIIEESSIAAGWFGVFGLGGGTKLEYVLGNGKMLFEKPMGMEDFAASSQVLKASIPIHDINRNYYSGMNSSTNNWMFGDASINVYGWFSDAAFASSITALSIKKAAVTTLTKVAKYQPLLLPSVPRSLFLVSSPSVPTVAQLVDTTNIANAYFVNGGAAGVCGPSAEYISCMQFASAMIDQDGGDSAAPFYRVFKRQANGGPVNISSAAGGVLVTADLLPDTPGLFDSFTAFKSSSLGNNVGGDDMRCDPIALANFGFIPATSVAGGTPSLSMNIPITSAEIYNPVTGMAGGILICGAKGGQMYQKGIFIHSGYLGSALGGGMGGGGGGMGGGGAGPMDHLALKSPSALNQGICVPINADLVDASGNPAGNSAASPIIFTLSNTTPASVNFYPDPGCASATLPSISFAPGSNYQQFYVKSNLAVATSTTLNLTTTSPDLPVKTASSTLTTVAAGQATMLNMSASGGQPLAGAAYGACFQIYLAANSSNGSTDATYTGSYTVTVNAPITGAVMYPGAACTGTPSTVGSFAAGVAIHSISIPQGANPNPGQLSITATSTSGGISIGAMSGMLIGAAGTPTSFGVATTPTPSSGICNVYTVTVRDGTGAVVNLPSGTTMSGITIQNMAGGGIFYNTNCGGATISGTPTFSITGPANSFTFGYTPSGSGVSLQVSGAPGPNYIWGMYSYMPPAYSGTISSLTSNSPVIRSAPTTINIVGSGFDGTEIVYVDTTPPTGPIYCTGYSYSPGNISCTIPPNVLVAGSNYQFYVQHGGSNLFIPGGPGFVAVFRYGVQSVVMDPSLVNSLGATLTYGVCYSVALKLVDLDSGSTPVPNVAGFPLPMNFADFSTTYPAYTPSAMSDLYSDPGCTAPVSPTPNRFMFSFGIGQQMSNAYYVRGPISNGAVGYRFPTPAGGSSMMIMADTAFLSTILFNY